MAGYPLSFSQNGDVLVYASPDGVLKLWDSSTGQLNKEYTPSSHLSATCSCLSWGPGRHLKGTPKKKRRKLSGGMGEIQELDLIAIGTTNGNILIYSVAKADIHTQLDKGHTDCVNDICWHPDKPLLYSCSSDGHVIEWDIVSGKCLQNWKADKSGVNSLCLCSHHHLLTGGRSIKLWDIATKKVLTKFTGHATEVFKLISVSTSDHAAESEMSYFLSAARNDRVVNAWQINTSSKERNSLASFTLPDDAAYVHLSQSSIDQSIILVVVTKNGQVLVFEHTLNGKLVKPLTPKLRIQVVSPGGSEKGDTPQPIMVLAAHVHKNRDSLIIAHGNHLRPTFEKVVYDRTQREICLVREDPMKSCFRKESHVSRIKTPMISKELIVQVPSTTKVKTPILAGDKRRKRQNSVGGGMSMEDRLHAMSLDQSGKMVPTIGGGDHILGQALQSSDAKLLNNVLRCSKSNVITKSVQKLPIGCVLPLVKELSARMQGPINSASVAALWLKCVMTVHTSYLMTFPEIVNKLSSLYQMMEVQASTFSKLSRLQGKLDLVLGQITSRHLEDEQEAAGKAQKPLVLYQDESSDEDILMSDLLPSESGEDWDELWDEESEETSAGEQEVNGKSKGKSVPQQEEEDMDDDEEEDGEEDSDDENKENGENSDDDDDDDVGGDE